MSQLPPHDESAEAAVLSTVLLDGRTLDEINEFLEAEHFYLDKNRRIYQAAVSLHERGETIDIVSVAANLRANGRLEQIGGPVYLAEVIDSTPAVAHVENHAKIVRDHARVRQLIASCQKFAAQGYQGCEDAQEFISSAEEEIFAISRVGVKSPVRPLGEAIEGAFEILSEAAKKSSGITGIPTRIVDLDMRCSGLHPGDLYIVAGRPGMGKTSFVLNVAVNVALPTKTSDGESPGHAVAFFSLEMPREQLASRVLASEGRVDVSRIRSGQLTQTDWNQLTEAAERLSSLPLWLDDTPAISLLDLRGKVRRLQSQIERLRDKDPSLKPLGLVVVDYLQLMSGRKGAKSREQEISEISRGLKQLAKESGVSVIALSQLNRSVETRNAQDKRPQLSDLRESGAIEQDADTIMFIYRDEYYFDDSPDNGIAEVILAKQRNGPTGKIRISFDSKCTRFDNLAPEEYDLDVYDDFGI